MKLRKVFSLLTLAVFLSAMILSPAYAAPLSPENMPKPDFQSIWNVVQEMNGQAEGIAADEADPATLDPAPVNEPAPVSLEGDKGTKDPAPAPQPETVNEPAPSPAPEYAPSKAELRVVELVNIEREKAGLKPLVADPLVGKGARAKSQDMVDNRYFGHTSPTYGSPFDMMKAFGIRYRNAGENIASGQRTPEAVVKAWMNSPGHRANILSPKYGKIGVGYAYTSRGNYNHYWTQWFTN